MNKLKGIILVVSICFASIMMPFNIYADTAIIVGTDVSLIDSTLIRTDTYTSSSGTVVANNMLYTYKVTAQLDNNYVGYLLLKMDYSYYNNPQSGFRTDSGSVTRRVFINGDKAEFNFSINTWYSLDPLLRNTTNATPNVVIQDQGVTLLSELDSIQQIIDILNDLYNSTDQVEGLLNDQLAQLELVVSNTSLANQYLDTISKMHQFNIPFESFTFSFYMLRKQYTLNDIYRINYFNYPLYNLNANDNLFEFYGNKDSNDDFILIFGINKPITNNEQLNLNLGINDGVLTYENRIYAYRENNYRFYIIKISAGQFTSSGQKNIYVKNNSLILPIYANTLSFNNFSTDFALQFGLTNKLLDDLDIIANGTTASNDASQQLDSDTSDFNMDRDDLIDIEDSMGNSMDSAMNQITPNNNGLSGFGGNFLNSAVWVRTQFERLTNNTPYGSLIVYGMTLGLALLLLGKVML